MTVDPTAAARTAPVADGVATARTTRAPDGFAVALQREIAATAAVATPSAQAPAALRTPVTFGQMIAMTASTPSAPTLLPPGASPLAHAAAAQTAAAAPAAPAATTPGGYVLPVDGRFTSPFGPRVHPVTGQRKMHAGVDIAAPTGTPVRAAAAGVVSFAGDRGGYGNVVIVDHPDGSQTRYAHQHSLEVSAGQRVAAGEVIGSVGSTGLSTGPHLHFEVRRDGEPVDPAPLLGL